MTTTISRLRRAAVTASGALALATYTCFLAVLMYFIAFLAGVVVPRTVDAGGPEASTGRALLWDTALFLGFAVPHSVMARSGFKSWMARVVPRHLERTVYVLIATVALAALFWQWRPIPARVWDVDGAARLLLTATYALGWFVVVLSTFLINHFDLFGLRQVYLHARRRDYRPLGFRTPALYRVVRHPMMTGFVMLFWSSPTMTCGHVVFAALFTGYIVVGIRLEERDLRRTLSGYDEYARRVPRLVPRVAAVTPAARRPQ